MTLTELKEKWEELFIRFNTSPKLYQKIDFLKLLKFLRNIITHGTGIVESDLKTINGESLVGEGEVNLPIATTETVGVVKVGDNLIVEPDGRLSATCGTSMIPITAEEIDFMFNGGYYGYIDQSALGLIVGVGVFGD